MDFFLRAFIAFYCMWQTTHVLGTPGQNTGKVIVLGQCPQACTCATDRKKMVKVDCSDKNLSQLPSEAPTMTKTLNLEVNDIKEISSRAFKDFHFLKTLTLGGNGLTRLDVNAFQGLRKLEILEMQDNYLSDLRPHLFSGATNLRQLKLSGNYIADLPQSALFGLHNLQKLHLDDNRIEQVPVRALTDSPNLDYLNLAVNQIQEIPDNAFSNLPKLEVLLLRENRISIVGIEGFAGTPLCRVLSLEDNSLTTFPKSVSNLTLLVDLNLSDNKIQFLPEGAFSNLHKLQILELRNNPLRSVGISAFKNLPVLNKLLIEQLSEQREFPDFSGCNKLQELALSGSRIRTLPHDLCRMLPDLRLLSVTDNKLSNLSGIGDCYQLRYLDASRNYMSQLTFEDVGNLTNLEELDVSHNFISSLDENVFHMNPLRKLNLAYNTFTYLPVKGLSQLTHLNLTGVNNMLFLPPVQILNKLQFLNAAFSYHCCQVRAEWQTAHQDKSIERGKHPTQCFPEPGPLTPCTNLLPSVLARAVLWLALVVSFILNLTIVFSSTIRRCVSSFRQAEFRRKIAERSDHERESLENANHARLLAENNSGPMEAFEVALCHLALADIIATGYIAVIVSYDTIKRNEFAEFGAWWQQSVPCRAAGFFLVMGVQLAFFTVLIAAVERYLSTMFPLKPEKHMGKAVIALALSAAWVISVATAVVTLYSGAKWYEGTADNPLPPFNGATCLPWSTDFPYVAVLIGVHFLFCLVVVVLCLLMFCARQKRSWLSPQKNTRTQIALIVACNVVLILPLAIVGLLTSAIATYPSVTEPYIAAWRLGDFDVSEYVNQVLNVDLLLMLVLLLICLRLLLNPILYVAFSKGFRRDASAIAKKLFCADSTDRVNENAEVHNSAHDPDEDFTFQCGTSAQTALVKGSRTDEKLLEAPANNRENFESEIPFEHQLRDEQHLHMLQGSVPHESNNVHKAVVYPQLSDDEDDDDGGWYRNCPVYRYGEEPNTQAGGFHVGNHTAIPLRKIHPKSLSAQTRPSNFPLDDTPGCSTSRRNNNSLRIDISKERLPPLAWQQLGENGQPQMCIGTNKLSHSCESSTSKDSGIQSEPDFFAQCACSTGSNSLARSSQTSDLSTPRLYDTLQSVPIDGQKSYKSAPTHYSEPFVSNHQANTSQQKSFDRNQKRAETVL